MVRPSVALVADDFTGANDAAGRFASYGWPCWVSLDLTEAPSSARFGALNARTRFLRPSQAQRRSAQVWQGCKPAQWYFQKIDSTLRGWPGMETLGLLQQKSPRFIAFCSAYPLQGRRVVGGALKVHGRDLMKTEYASDPLSPASTGRMLRLFPQGLAQRVPLAVVVRGKTGMVRWMRLQLRKARPARIFVFDCDEERQLAWIVRACLALGGRAFAGASGLAGALAATQTAVKARPWRGPKQGLVLAGSVSATSLLQAQWAQAQGYLWETLQSLKKGNAGITQLKRWRKALSQGVVLSSIEHRSQIDRQAPQRVGRERLTALAQLALALGVAQGKTACLLTGGHTAEIFFEQAHLVGNWIYGEWGAGLPWGLAEGRGQAWIATKPGGFGKTNTLVNFFKRLGD